MEIMVILVAGLLVLGPKRLPEAARQIGKAMAELRRVTGGFQAEMRDAFETTVSADPEPAPPAAVTPPATPPAPATPADTELHVDPVAEDQEDAAAADAATAVEQEETVTMPPLTTAEVLPMDPDVHDGDPSRN
ncbi:MAG: sec-independent protein translocase protein TatB [Actinomycetota bacterium]|jgi:Sec-independent protein translocase protein TatA